MGVSAISSTPGGFTAQSQMSLAGQRTRASAATPTDASASTSAGALRTASSTPSASAPASASPVKADDTRTSTPAANGEQSSVKLSQEALSLIAKLKARDSGVRQHEAAHMAAAGGIATSGASYTFQKGPDGISYAIGGEVSIDTSPGRTPQETIQRASTIRAAALAPADPSGQDRAVAARAGQMELQARGELAQQSRESAEAAANTNTNTNANANANTSLSRAYGTNENTQPNSLSVFA